MSAASKRGDRAEVRAAKLLKTPRIGGAKKRQSVPDAAPIRLADGRLLAIEVKHRARLPQLLVKALEQARRYVPTASLAAAIFYMKGTRAGLAIIDAEFFAELVGCIEASADRQLALALTVPKGSP